ncbi:DUF6266 family protein [Marinilabilia rubra]|uniref:Uncharacterized protein n=1 Tax=Marinilabilia rubra TaxID=2162893 RepID=A0A2U2B5F3_9BACT|nr:DUF6266 family protein [Marinilabilia rubra]PWD98311.1 hypothetical protein DDZ16_16155 [Marinilabilia rubra]
MARLKQGINGPGQGRVGNVIMYEMYGKTYLRSRPNRYKDKKSEKQLAQRQRLTLAQNLVRYLNHLIRITMKDISTGRSTYHTAVSMNLKEAIEGNYPDQFINPEKVVLSKGDLTTPETVSFKKTDEGILVEWSAENKRVGSNHPSDNLIWCMKDLELLVHGDYQITTIKRHQGKALLLTPISREPVELWIMFRSADETMISDTKWVGTID